MNISSKLKLLLWAGALFPSLLLAQGNTSTPQNLTLEQCIEYALANQPEVMRARIDEAIGDREIKSSLSAWLPQIAAQYNVSHNFELQTAAFGENLTRIGRENNSNILLQASQTLYNNDVLLATRGARYARLQLDQNTTFSSINTVVDVSKSFYDILLTQEQLRILDENIVRQEKQYQDARNRYESGLVDKIDYQRASITLANTRSDRKRAQESIKAKQALLKELMGYPAETDLQLAYDQNTLQQQELTLDTTQNLNFNARIELQQLQTRQQLLQLNTAYHRWGFLPTVNTFINYNWLYLNDNFSELYNTSYPTSAVGLQVALPIFQGTRRLQNLKIAQLQEERLQVDIENVRNRINTEYQAALANYKSDYNDWLTLRQNAQVAEEVYNTVKLQYDEGIKTFLEVIVAETDLRTSQLNYYNSLFRVLSSKLDYERALGTINIAN